MAFLFQQTKASDGGSYQVLLSGMPESQAKWQTERSVPLTFGNLAIIGTSRVFRPMALRPCLSTGLPLSVFYFFKVQSTKKGLDSSQAF